MPDLIVHAQTQRLDCGRLSFPCAIGKSGFRPAADKREGDGATPLGTFALRRLLYRPDRLAPPKTALDVTALAPDDGWCDAPGDARYNRPVRLPYSAHAEMLWRDDHVYDLVVILGHNDDPVVTGLGSAVFFHVTRNNFAPTEGCIAVDLAAMIQIVTLVGPLDRMIVRDD